MPLACFLEQKEGDSTSAHAGDDGGGLEATGGGGDGVGGGGDGSDGGGGLAATGGGLAASAGGGGGVSPLHASQLSGHLSFLLLLEHLPLAAQLAHFWLKSTHGATHGCGIGGEGAGDGGAQ